jgi:hypothetical protein
MRLFAYYVALMVLACENGSTLAQRWCAECHIVSGDQIKGTDIAPSFASIAERPDLTPCVPMARVPWHGTIAATLALGLANRANRRR